MPFAATWMQLEILTLREVRKGQKPMIPSICGIKIGYLFTKQKQTQRHRKQTYGYQREKRIGEGSIRSLRLVDTNHYI